MSHATVSLVRLAECERRDAKCTTLAPFWKLCQPSGSNRSAYSRVMPKAGRPEQIAMRMPAARALRRAPDGGMYCARRADQRAVHVDAYQANHPGLLLFTVGARNDLTTACKRARASAIAEVLHEFVASMLRLVAKRSTGARSPTTSTTASRGSQAWVVMG